MVLRSNVERSPVWIDSVPKAVEFGKMIFEMALQPEKREEFAMSLGKVPILDDRPEPTSDSITWRRGSGATRTQHAIVDLMGDRFLLAALEYKPPQTGVWIFGRVNNIFGIKVVEVNQPQDKAPRRVDRYAADRHRALPQHWHDLKHRPTLAQRTEFNQHLWSLAEGV